MKLNHFVSFDVFSYGVFLYFFFFFRRRCCQSVFKKNIEKVRKWAVISIYIIFSGEIFKKRFSYLGNYKAT